MQDQLAGGLETQFVQSIAQDIGCTTRQVVAAAELLARHIGGRLEQALVAGRGAAITEIEVSVDECDGQQGVWRLSRQPG